MTHHAPTLDGLNPDALRGHLSGLTVKQDASLAALTTHLTEHPGAVRWSGGKDSTVALHLALQVNPNVAVCFFDSGLEFPENRIYMQHLTDVWNVNLHIIKATPDALSIMAASGGWNHELNAPTPPLTISLHDALIVNPSRQATADHGAGEINGMRTQESAGRRALLASGRGYYRRADGTQVLAPLWNWTDDHVNGYLARHGVPENPVYTKLRALGASGKDLRVGLAFDGNCLEYGRVTWLRRGWPDLYASVERALPRVREWR